MWKNPAVEDEIPLTHTTSNVTRETRARFDSLLLAALGQTKQQRQQKNKDEKSLQCNDKHADKQKSISGKSKLKNTENNSLASDNGSPLSSGNSRDEEEILKQYKVQKAYKHDSVKDKKDNEALVLNKRLKNETNKSKVSNTKNVNSAKNENDTECGSEEVEDTKLKLEISSHFHESVSNSSIYEKSNVPKLKTVPKKPVPLPRQKSLTCNEVPEVSSVNEPETLIKEALQNDSVAATGELSIINKEEHVTRTLSDESLPKKERKKKKKNKCIDEDNGNEIELQQLTHVDLQSSRKKLGNGSKSRTKHHSIEAQTTIAIEAENPSVAESSQNKIIGVHIHKSDFLKINPLIRHPVVKVYLLDVNTGDYLKKSTRQRPVSFFYESEDVDYILPLMTEVYDYKVRRSLIPQWEELLIFNEDFEHNFKDNPSVLILFEILDFVNFDIASSQYRKLGAEGGWHRIAWAFLKPLGANGILNIEKQVRLQLYKPQKLNKTACGGCEVYQWWIGGEWKRYPATLYVTIKGICPPEQLSPVLRSRSALQGELSESMQFDFEQSNDSDEKEVAISDNENSLAASLLSKVTHPHNVPIWSRLPLQSCQIPNMRKLSLPTASKGCFMLQFSNSGCFLACATVGEEKYNIIVYTIPNGQVFTTLCGHLGLVYDLNWSPNDRMLISASADCTACLWSMEEPTVQAIQMLPHPSFVYSALFHPGNGSILATGCCDHVVRIWSRPRKSLHYELMQELEGHSGFINSVIINILTHAMYTGDSTGGIIEWTPIKIKSKLHQMQWKLNRKMDISEIKDTVVNKLLVHPQGKRLLIHARDGQLRMLDIATGTVIQWYSGALNHRFQTNASISPCGGLVIAGSEDGTVYVWHTDTGEQLAVYSGLNFQRGANAVHYHPHEHMIAFGSYGSPANVVVCGYDSRSSGNDVGLQIISHKDNTEDKNLVPDIPEASHSKLNLSPVHTVKQSRTKKNSNEIDTPGHNSIAGLVPEETQSVCSTRASTVNLTSILERMDEILKESSSKHSKLLPVLSKSADDASNNTKQNINSMSKKRLTGK